jgi:uncharacterized delta-60 repeat protein
MRRAALAGLCLLLGCAGPGTFEIELPSGTLNVPQGGTTELSVRVVRLDGFAGDVHLRAESLPAGVTSTETIVSSDSTSGTFTLSAPPSVALPAPVLARVRGDGAHRTERASLALTVRGAPGSLDTSFGSGGQASLLEEILDAEALPDGGLLVTGYDDSSAKVCRLTVDGSLDQAFGAAGCAALGTHKFFGTNLLVDETGFFLIASADMQIAIARFHLDGTLDLGFGDGGVVFHGAPGTYERPMYAVRLEDGFALTAYHNDGIDQGMMLLRFDLDGSPTAKFGTNGRIELGPHWGVGLERRPNGGLVTGGDSLLFLTASGALDTSFAGGALETPEPVHTIAVHGDEVFAAGATNVYRYSSAGKLEQQYVELGDWAGITDLTFDDAGSMLLFGSSGANPYFPHFLLGRRTASGVWDESFSPGGVHSYLGGPFAGGVIVSPDGRYMLSGTNRTPDYVYSGVIFRVWN